MSAQHTPGPLDWSEIITKQRALIDRCRDFNARAYEVRCLKAMERAAESHAALVALTNQVDAGTSADYRALQETAIARRARAAIAKATGSAA